MKGETTIVIKLVEFKIKFLREWLFRTAMSDGILSDDELNILFSIEFNLTLLQDSVRRAFEDHVINKHEKDEIYGIINKIEDDAISTARFDDCITQEDKRLLKILQKILVEFQKILLAGQR